MLRAFASSRRTPTRAATLVAALVLVSHANESRAQTDPIDPEVPVESEHARNTAGLGGIVRAAPRIQPYRPSRTAIWLEPMAPLLGLFGSPSYFNLNFGVSRSLARGLDAFLELGLGERTDTNGTYVTGGAAAGLLLFLSGSEPMNGLFVAPRVQFSQVPNFNSGSVVEAVGVGFDVGYQIVRGGVFFGPVVGVTYNLAIPTSGTHGPQYASGFNVSLLRLGIALDGQGGSRGQREIAVHRMSQRNEGLDLARDRRDRSVAVWMLPAWMAIGPVLNRYNVGLGVTVPLVEHVDAVIEAGAEWGGENQRASYTTYEAAAGLQLVANRGAPLNGFFVHAKLYGRTASFGAFAGFVPTVTAGFGLDVGYQFTFGPVYFAPVVGFRLGATLLAGAGGDRSVAQNHGVVADPNISILRLGFAL